MVKVLSMQVRRPEFGYQNPWKCLVSMVALYSALKAETGDPQSEGANKTSQARLVNTRFN